MVTENRPSGWYRDPSGRPNTLRWWDGNAWTDDYRSQSDFLQSSSSTPSTPSAPATPPAETPVQTPQASFSASASGGSFAGREQAAAQPTMAAPGSGTGGASSEPWPGSDRPIPAPVTPVQFEAVEPNRGRKRAIAGTIAVVVAVGAALGGYLIGKSGDDGDKTASTSKSPSVTAGSPAAPVNDPSSPEGFAGNALTGGKPIAGGQVVTGPKSLVTFSMPTGWTPQVDPKATSEESRFVLGPYQCTGRVGDACARGTVVHNLRLLSGGWSDLKSLTLGMGGELIALQSGGQKPPSVTGPMKQKDVTIQGLPGYLAMWDLPMVAGKSAPSSYCAVLALRVAPDSPEIAVMQMCVDRTPEAPPASVLDQIANSIQVKS